MSYTNKTPNLNLPQWVGTEKPERTDFNAAFDAIDTEVTATNTSIANFLPQQRLEGSGSGKLIDKYSLAWNSLYLLMTGAVTAANASLYLITVRSSSSNDGYVHAVKDGTFLTVELDGRFLSLDSTYSVHYALVQVK